MTTTMKIMKLNIDIMTKRNERNKELCLCLSCEERKKEKQKKERNWNDVHAERTQKKE